MNVVFMDLGFEGPKYTWSRHFENGNSIWERLDGCLAMSSWFLKFPGSKVYHLRCDSSDHIPFLIVFSGLDIPMQKKIFHFEEMRLSNRECEDVVFLAWNGGDAFGFEGDVLAKIDKCGKDLSWWNKNVFGNVRRELERLKKLWYKPNQQPWLVAITFGLYSLRRRFMFCWIGSLLCGLKGQDYYGQGMGIRIQSISIVKQQEYIEEIRWRVLEMRKETGESKKMIFLPCWLTISRIYSLHVSRMGPRMCCHASLLLLMMK